MQMCIYKSYYWETEDLLCSLYEASPTNLLIISMSIRRASNRKIDLNNLISIIYY